MPLNRLHPSTLIPHPSIDAMIPFPHPSTIAFVFISLLIISCGPDNSGGGQEPDTIHSDTLAQHQHLNENSRISTADTMQREMAGSTESIPSRGATQKDDSNLAPTRVSKAQIQKIVLKTVEYQLIFDQDIFSVKAGMPVEIEFINVDEMPHNLLIIKPGSLERVGEAADKMARDPNAAKIHFVPQTSDVLYSTPLLMIDQSYTLRFTAPKEPGDYPYVCTYPGHWRTMKGIMKVTK